MKRLPLHAGLSLVLCACGPDPLPFQRARPQALVQAPGDQIHPDLAGTRLVWFDLGEDPNGRCYAPQSGPDWDDSCIGRVRGMDLTSGAVRTLSEPIPQETRPHLSGDRVIWRCIRDGQRGLCVTPFARQRITFHPDLAWSGYYDDAAERTLAVGSGYLIWAQITTWYGETVFRLVWADVGSGREKVLAVLEQMPAEVVEDGSRVLWTDRSWTGSGHAYRTQALDLDTREYSLLFEDDQPRYGLGANADLFAWQETDPDGRVHVFARDRRGAGTRVESAEAQVSSQARLALAGHRVAWLDHREGDYRIALADLADRTEAWATPEEAVVGLTSAPATSDELMVWADLRNGDWDLYVVRL